VKGITLSGIGSEWLWGNRDSSFLVSWCFSCAPPELQTLGYAFQRRIATTAEFDRELKLAKDEAHGIREQVILPTEKKVPAGENFTAALQKFGLSGRRRGPMLPPLLSTLSICGKFVRETPSRWDARWRGHCARSTTR